MGDAQAQPVDCLLNHLGEEHVHGVRGNTRQAAPQVSPFVTAHVGEERAQIAKHALLYGGTLTRSISRSNGQDVAGLSRCAQQQISSSEAKEDIRRPRSKRCRQVVHVTHRPEEAIDHPICKSYGDGHRDPGK